MGFVSKPVAAAVRRRTQGRLDVRLHAKLATLAATYPAILEDISRKGAKLILASPARRGSDAVLKWNDFEAFCTISWVSGNRCGVLFARPLSEAPLRATLSLNHHSHLSEEAGLDTEAARAWAEGHTRSGFD